MRVFLLMITPFSKLPVETLLIATLKRNICVAVTSASPVTIVIDVGLSSRGFMMLAAGLTAGALIQPGDRVAKVVRAREWQKGCP